MKGLFFLLTLFALTSACVQQQTTTTTIKTAESRVSWDLAVKILNSGEVNVVFQSHELDVTLRLKNGNIIQTKEPYIDAIFDEIRKCGDPCKSIARATE